MLWQVSGFLLTYTVVLSMLNLYTSVVGGEVEILSVVVAARCHWDFLKNCDVYDFFKIKMCNRLNEIKKKLKETKFL